ncbi:MAG TPA: ATP-binding cassette domain-containing protein, partial [Noviherbaspirillum sp.]|nr:ATP-binding cassette domain-containing protein [Noviherbaspirillum sp.]
MIVIDIARQLHSAAGPMRLAFAARIERHELATLFGPSGAGKTTILRLLAGLASPDEGRIEVDGVAWFDSARRIDLPARQRSIGFVFQDYALFPNLTVRENIAYALETKDEGWVDELVALADLKSLQQRMPATLSGGQKQRVALVRALARKPALLLLDEPLSALDHAMRVQLQDDLLRMHQRFGLTTMLVSHDVGEVFRLSRRVLRIEGGRLVEDGSPEQVFLHRRMAGRFNLRAQVLSVRRQDVVHVVALLIGQEITEVIASEDEIAGLRPGDFVSVSSKAFSPI